MMNGPKKSDLAEVAVKPMNKAALEAVVDLPRFGGHVGLL
jgi:hypothetical protein